VLAIIAEEDVLATFEEQTPETAVEKSIVIGEPVEVKETCPQLPPTKKVKKNMLNSRMLKVVYFLVKRDFRVGNEFSMAIKIFLTKFYLFLLAKIMIALKLYQDFRSGIMYNNF
jgi:hypothetical protein